MNAPNPILHKFRKGFMKCAFSSTALHDALPRRAVQPVVNLYSSPNPKAPVDTQLLFGEEVDVFGTHDGWAWVQSKWDYYQGYCRIEELGEFSKPNTHRVSQLWSSLLSEPKLRAEPVGIVSMASELCVVDFISVDGYSFARLSSGTYLPDLHIAPLHKAESDFVSVAERLRQAPYLWGGKSSLGLDCSSLVQLALWMSGQRALRDSDMQLATLGEPLPGETSLHDLRRGDLVFWKGHVGIVRGPNALIHCNGTFMSVVMEPMDFAVERIKKDYAEPIAFKRLGAN